MNDWLGLDLDEDELNISVNDLLETYIVMDENSRKGLRLKVVPLLKKMLKLLLLEYDETVEIIKLIGRIIEDFPNELATLVHTLLKQLQKLIQDISKDAYIHALRLLFSIATTLPYGMISNYILQDLTSSVHTNYFPSNLQISSLFLYASSCTVVNDDDVLQFASTAAQYLSSTSDTFNVNDICATAAVDVLAVCLILKCPSELSAIFSSIDDKVPTILFSAKFSKWLRIALSQEVQCEACSRAQEARFPSLQWDPHLTFLLSTIRVKRENAVNSRANTGGGRGVASSVCCDSLSAIESDVSPDQRRGSSGTGGASTSSLEISVESLPGDPLLSTGKDNGTSSRPMSRTESTGSTCQPSWTSLSASDSTTPMSPWVWGTRSESELPTPNTSTTTGLDRSKLLSLKKSRHRGSRFGSCGSKVFGSEDEEEPVNTAHDNMPHTSLGIRRHVTGDLGQAQQQGEPGDSDVEWLNPHTPMESGVYGADGSRVQRVRKPRRRLRSVLSSDSLGDSGERILSNTIGSDQGSESEGGLYGSNSSSSRPDSGLSSSGFGLGSSSVSRALTDTYGEEDEGGSSTTEPLGIAGRAALRSKVSALRGNKATEAKATSNITPVTAGLRRASPEQSDGDGYLPRDGSWGIGLTVTGKKTVSFNSQTPKLPPLPVSRQASKEELGAGSAAGKRQDDAGPSTYVSKGRRRDVAPASSGQTPSEPDLPSGTSTVVAEESGSVPVFKGGLYAAGNDDYEYTASCDIKPSASPERDLKEVVAALDSSEWTEVFSALTTVRQLFLHHRATVLAANNSLHLIVKLVVKQVDNLRSVVAKNALLALGDLFQGLGKGADVEVAVAVPCLLKRAVDSSLFLSESAEASLLEMVKSVSVQRSLSALLLCADNRSQYIRGKVSRLLLRLVNTRTSELRGCKDMPSLLGRLGRSVDDQTPEARAGSRSTVKALLRQGLVSRTELERYLPADKVEKCLQTEDSNADCNGSLSVGRMESNAGLGYGKTLNRRRPKLDTADSTKGEQDAAVASQSEALSISSFRPPLHPPHQQKAQSTDSPAVAASSSSAGSSKDTLKSTRTAPIGEWPEIQAVPDLVLSLTAGKSWTDRKAALTTATELVCSNWRILQTGGKLDKVLEAILSRVEDGSVKVCVHAVQSLLRIQEQAPTLLPLILNTIGFASGLLAGAASVNKEVRVSGEALLWLVLDACPLNDALTPICTAAVHEKDRIRALCLRVLGSLVAKRSPPLQTIMRTVYPVVEKSVTAAGTKAEIRNAGVEALRGIQSCVAEPIWKWTSAGPAQEELKRVLS